MRILQVNKFYWQCAGPERYMFELSALLRRQGHSLAFFAMQHERNLPCDCSQYFVSPIDYGPASVWYRMKTALRTVGKTVYSLESKRKIKELIKAERPEIAHLHGISRQISPSILHVLRRYDVPVVQTVHNAELVCPAAHLFIERRREICERCLRGGVYNTVLHRCVKDSLTASLLSAAAHSIHRILRIHEKCIDLFICPSRFLAGKLVQGGIPKEKVRHLPNFIDLDSYAPDYEPGQYGLYMGRLSPEKGLPTLLDAAAIAREVPLVIAGEGRQAGDIARLADENQLGNVKLVGQKQGDELKQLIRHSAFVVLPSECYENSPMALYEGGALGKPVIASRIGGVPELVDEGRNGLLFQPGNAEELADKMLHLKHDKPLCREMGRCGRRKVEQLCGKHYGRLMALYEEAMTQHPESTRMVSARSHEEDPSAEPEVVGETVDPEAVGTARGGLSGSITQIPVQ